MGMIECGQYLAFLAKAPENEIRVHASLDELDCDATDELLVGAYRFIDSSHTAAADFALDSVGAEPAANHGVAQIFIDGQRLQHAEIRIGDEYGLFQNVARALMLQKQRLHVASQPFVGGARLGQVS